ncbi:hypothetical protein ACWDRX_14975, partial [Streptomyces nigra]
MAVGPPDGRSVSLAPVDGLAELVGGTSGPPPPPSASSAAADAPATAAGYFPYKPYCGNCEKDLTTVTSYDDD